MSVKLLQLRETLATDARHYHFRVFDPTLSVGLHVNVKDTAQRQNKDSIVSVSFIGCGCLAMMHEP